MWAIFANSQEPTGHMDWKLLRGRLPDIGIWIAQFQQQQQQHPLSRHHRNYCYDLPDMEYDSAHVRPLGSNNTLPEDTTNSSLKLALFVLKVPDSTLQRKPNAFSFGSANGSLSADLNKARGRPTAIAAHPIELVLWTRSAAASSIAWELRRLIFIFRLRWGCPWYQKVGKLLHHFQSVRLRWSKGWCRDGTHRMLDLFSGKNTVLQTLTDTHTMFCAIIAWMNKWVFVFERKRRWDVLVDGSVLLYASFYSLLRSFDVVSIMISLDFFLLYIFIHIWL